MASRVSAVVVGAGIAGVAVAQGLRRAGCGVDLIERGAHNRGSGYQLSILPNGKHALRELGLLDAFERSGLGNPIRHIVLMEGRTCRVLQRLPLEYDGVPGTSFYRSDIHTCLMRGLEGPEPIFDREVISVHQDLEGVRVECRGGQMIEADFAVLADGAHSGLRSHVLGGGYGFRHLLTIVMAAARIDPTGSSDGDRLLRRQIQESD